MPLKTWDTKADFDACYNIGLEPDGHPNTRPEVRGNYERRALFNAADHRLDSVTPRWTKLLDEYQWPLDTSILVLGCGFGWAIEFLEARGYTDVWGVDSSAYIQSMKDTINPGDGIAHSLVPDKISPADLTVPSEVNSFLQEAGHQSGFQVVVTEHVLSSWSDEEVTGMSAFLRGLKLVSQNGGAVIHLEQDGDARLPGFNWHTIAEWQALLPNDTVRK